MYSNNVDIYIYIYFKLVTQSFYYLGIKTGSYKPAHADLDRRTDSRSLFNSVRRYFSPEALQALLLQSCLSATTQ